MPASPTDDDGSNAKARAPDATAPTASPPLTTTPTLPSSPPPTPTPTPTPSPPPSPSPSRPPRWVPPGVGPALVMALLCGSLWSSIHWWGSLTRSMSSPHGVRSDHAMPARRSMLHTCLLPAAFRNRSHHHHHRWRRGIATLPEFAVPEPVGAMDTHTERVMDIYCRGPLLYAVQMAHVFPDSKHFVDMPLKANSSVFQVLLEFQQRRLSMTEFRPPRQQVAVTTGTEHGHGHGHGYGGAMHAKALRQFVDTHFDPPGSDLDPITPVDYQELVLPTRVAAIEDRELRDWAIALHHHWRTLGRVPRPHVVSSMLHTPPWRRRGPGLDLEPSAASSPPPPPPHVLIVPGGRFRESYYWDSYWIVEGLLVSGMTHTARGIVAHLLEFVAAYGFVPNGGRVYYLTRSQPPMLSDMVRLVAHCRHIPQPLNGHKNNQNHLYQGHDDEDEEDEEGEEVEEEDDMDGDYDASDICLDVAYLRSVVPLLEKEYAFWMQRGPGGHAVELRRLSTHRNVTGDMTADAEETRHVLNRYVSNANHPRPESFREDVAVAAELYGSATTESAPNHARYFNDVIAAAESGWDFSSRWLRDGVDMRSMFTSCVLPVDLNAVLYRMERNLMRFHLALGNTSRHEFYAKAAAARQRAMDAVLWNESAAAWKDFNLDTQTHSSVVSVSDYAPLWARAFNASDTTRLARIVESLSHSGLLQVGGVQTTLTFTGQQWDAPNAWPPAQDIVVEGLLAVNLPEARQLASKLAKAWVHTSLKGWRDTGLMFEKYNASEAGGLGIGGEYFPQFGFGWSNGVILKFLTTHQHLLSQDSDAFGSPSD